MPVTCKNKSAPSANPQTAPGWHARELHAGCERWLKRGRLFRCASADSFLGIHKMFKLFEVNVETEYCIQLFVKLHIWMNTSPTFQWEGCSLNSSKILFSSAKWIDKLQCCGLETAVLISRPTTDGLGLGLRAVGLGLGLDFVKLVSVATLISSVGALDTNICYFVKCSSHRP